MSSAYIAVALRQRVAEAARWRCGYCRTSQRIIGPLLEIDHIIPEARGGLSDEENLWLDVHFVSPSPARLLAGKARSYISHVAQGFPVGAGLARAGVRLAVYL